jgi:hypothetical protein
MIRGGQLMMNLWQFLGQPARVDTDCATRCDTAKSIRGGVAFLRRNGNNRVVRLRHDVRPHLEALESIVPLSAGASLGSSLAAARMALMTDAKPAPKPKNPADWNFLATALEGRMSWLIEQNGNSSVLTKSFRKSAIGLLEVDLRNAGVPAKPPFAIFSFEMQGFNFLIGRLNVGKNEATAVKGRDYQVSINTSSALDPLVSIAPTSPYPLKQFYTSPLYPPLRA